MQAQTQFLGNKSKRILVQGKRPCHPRQPMKRLMPASSNRRAPTNPAGPPSMDPTTITETSKSQHPGLAATSALQPISTWSSKATPACPPSTTNQQPRSPTRKRQTPPESGKWVATVDRTKEGPDSCRFEFSNMAVCAIPAGTDESGNHRCPLAPDRTGECGK